VAEAPPIRLAVLGHVNAGKTSLVRTLARRADIGQVDPAPGTTEQVHAVLRRIPGAPPLAGERRAARPCALAELVKRGRMATPRWNGCAGLSARTRAEPSPSAWPCGGARRRCGPACWMHASSCACSAARSSCRGLRQAHAALNR
jgi:hypothetical protein